MKLILLMLLGIVSYGSNSFAADVGCAITGAVRCMCPASMSVDCGGNRGNIRNEAPVKSVTVNIFSASGAMRTVTLPNPTGGARSFYGLEYNDYVRTQAKVKAGERIELAPNGLVIDGDTPLYADNEGTEQTTTAGAATSVRAETPTVVNCEYTGELPTVLSSTACTSRLCTSKVNCTFSNGQVATGTASCLANGDGSCPTANACAASTEVSTTRATVPVVPAAEGDAANKAGAAEL